jgi:peroxiredoxin
MLEWLRDARRWRALVLATLLLGGAWIALSATPAPPAPVSASPREGFAAPDFTLSTPDGAALALSSQRGKVVIVNVWASWCGPCRAEMPAIQQIYDAERERGLQVLAVNSTVQDTAAHAEAFAKELGLSIPILLDTDGAVTRAYMVRALPNTFIVDRKGVIRSVIFGGPISAAVLETKVGALLDEAP